MPKITIVDESDNVIGAEEKSFVRANGLRHRIARIFLLNSDGKVLLHKRSDKLTDNPGKWDQSVGGHVDEGEDYIDAARRETKEEMGISINDFTVIGKFYIERMSPSGEALRRFQTVFMARWDGDVDFDRNDISEVIWLEPDEIDAWIKASPQEFTRNFPRAFELLMEY